MSTSPKKYSKSPPEAASQTRSQKGTLPTPPTPKRLRSSIKLDPVNPADYFRYTMPYACEDCTHFARESESCTLGYNSYLHRREEQKRTYFLNGKMALCRFLEID